METTQVQNKDYFFCYSKSLCDYLHYQMGLGIITVAKNVRNDKVFSLFEQSLALDQAIKKYYSLKAERSTLTK
ncbi:hypothetical protein [Sporolactobacillus terrae]|uniref:hypothetical protein n=1 Tax=Sporolactobacillus terrae TaxID=269673 RepID=UPI00111A52DD|nr:hypothetical protein [Sporolactobacillus terrae]